MAKKTETKKTAADVLKPKRTVKPEMPKEEKAAKKKAAKAPVMCAKAEKLKQMREMMSALKKESDRIRDEMIKEFGIGVHPGFSIIEESRENISEALLKLQLGEDLSRFKVTSTFKKINFH